MKKGQIYEGMVEHVSFPNKCVVAVEGEEKKVVVKNALEGQKVRFRLSKARKGKCEGNLLEVLEASPIELTGEDVPCVHFALFEDEFYLKSQIEVLKESLELFILKYNPKARSGTLTE